MKAYQVDEITTFVANTPEEASELFREWCGDNCDADEGYPRELTDAELDFTYPAFDEDERRIPGRTWTIRQGVAEMTEPGYLCSTEW